MTEPNRPAASPAPSRSNGTGAPMDPRQETLQKRASMLGCLLYILAALVLGGIFLLHLLRG